MTDSRFAALPAAPDGRARRWSRIAEAPAAYWTVTRDGWHLRPMAVSDAGPVRDFLLAQYDAFNAGDNTPAGHAMFRDFVSVPALRGRLASGSVLQVAERRRRLLGVCEIHRDGYLTLLYVHGEHQGRGLGRRLLQATIERTLALAPGLARLRVRATPYARDFYGRLGFAETVIGLQEDRGMRFHAFELALTDPTTADGGTAPPARDPAPVVTGT